MAATSRYFPELASATERSDEHAIRALADRYSDAVNHRDWDKYRDTWTQDAVWNLGAPVNQEKQGLPAIMEEVQRAVGAMDLFVQMPHAFTLLHLIGDQATARVTPNEMGTIKRDSRALLGGADGMNILAMYTDTLVRQADRRWRYARREYRVVLFDGQSPRGKVLTA
jgi:ketosteroid isomerase-like protein